MQHDAESIWASLALTGMAKAASWLEQNRGFLLPTPITCGYDVGAQLAVTL